MSLFDSKEEKEFRKDVRHSIRLLFEVLGTIDQTVEITQVQLTTEFAALAAAVARVEQQQKEHGATTKGIEMKVSELRALFEAQAKDVGEIKVSADQTATNVDKVASEVQKVLDSLGDVDIPADAEAALESLKGSLAGAKASVSSLQTKVKAVDDKIPDPTEPITT